MTNIIGVSKMETVIEGNYIKAHESVLRAYNILAQVKYLLEQETPANIVLQLIHEMENPDPLYVSE